ncbi:hypothetical protein HaLaN_32382, partial [Haematococcus lacustris]
MVVAAVLPHVSGLPALFLSAMCGCPMQPATVCSGAKPDSLTSRNLFEKAKANVLPGGRDVPDTAWRRLLVAVQQARSCQELYRLYRTNAEGVKEANKTPASPCSEPCSLSALRTGCHLAVVHQAAGVESRNSTRPQGGEVQHPCENKQNMTGESACKAAGHTAHPCQPIWRHLPSPPFPVSCPRVASLQIWRPVHDTALLACAASLAYPRSLSPSHPALPAVQPEAAG